MERAVPSNYLVTELTQPAIDRPPTNYMEDVDVKDSAVLDVLNWVWQEWNLAGGKGFLDAVVSPLAGNYNSIKANGVAWQAVADQFGELVGNIGANAKILADQHWRGEAADVFGQFLVVYWKKGAAWICAQIGEFLKKGFDEVAEISMEMAEKAIKVIQTIISLAERLARRAIPVIGQAWTAIEGLLDLLGFDVDSIKNDIENIIAAWHSVKNLFATIESIVESMSGYFQAFTEVLAAVDKIPYVDTVAEAYEIKDTIQQGTADMETKKAEIESKVDGADKQLEEYRTKAEKAGAS